jgi:signal transduction histidine kinase
VAVSDITSLKQAEDAQRRMEALAVSNQQLKREIARRQTVEEALKSSEQHLSQSLEQSRRMQKQLRDLSHRILKVQEEERKRISRELHDEISQALVGISVRLESLSSEATVNPKGIRKHIARTQRLAIRAVDVVHRFARDLRPSTLDDLGLIPALRSFMKQFLEETGIRVSLAAFTELETLSSAKRTVLYRITQEALTNVARHARASRVDVNIERVAKHVRMQIKDDGKSFEVERMQLNKRGQHLGLIGMRERAEMVGGTFMVESAPGKGTTITAQIPFGKGAKSVRLVTASASDASSYSCSQGSGRPSSSLLALK